MDPNFQNSCAPFEINGRKIGPGYPCYVIAELSANHNGSYENAAELVHAAKKAGADAIKLQTYTPDSITIDCDKDDFLLKETIWKGRRLHDLYKQASTPYEWQPKLKNLAEELGMHCFSSPFDHAAVDFLEEMNVPAYKVASPEVIDLPLLKKIASTGKPVIMSSGMCTLQEITEGVKTLREAGCKQLALLKCTSAYPTPPEECNLATIPFLRSAFGVPTGLSDHTQGIAAPITSIALGASLIEKHFKMEGDETSPDASFSLTPAEMKLMIENIRFAEKAIGTVAFSIQKNESSTSCLRRSLYIVKDVKEGEVFSDENVRSIRPSYGIHTRYYDLVLGKHATCDIERGTPLSFTHFTK
eukprot:CAMPEP_0201476242 /NCGR_PEP_ID=MMETSP0151_2-20130828/1481_1 /ASSEMBLY_ACC=CAM_ASM_000257 /TAXON_ID=200890 /ORGANISM="Paramoeba atlantica, Strain 621/1 / CCAP 1560/9" /LENGTH=357 /DNA_ID=CAMNT_0047856549 /DNA_START=1947 /DNA_END=3020 /DNA_ORIENTATION=-